MRNSRRNRWIGAGVAATLLVLAACDDGDGSGGSAEAFCRLTEEANQQSGDATEAQVDAIVEAAPDEIRDDARTLGDALLRMQADPSTAAEVLQDEEITAAGERVDAFEAEHCGRDSDADEQVDADEGDDAEGDDAGDAAPEADAAGDLEAWCAITAEGVTEETADAYVAAAPADIRAETRAFVEATDEDDIEADSAALLDYAEENCPEG